MSSRVAGREHVVYRFFNLDGDLLYIGMTSNFVTRRQQHASGKPWWRFVDEGQTTFEVHSSRKDAQIAEAAAIAAESPRHNSPLWHPSGGYLSETHRNRLDAARDVRDAAREELRETVVAVLAEGASFSEASRVTGLSTNTLQRWKREGSSR